MAETVAVVGVVASGVSLASFALQLLDTVVKLRRLWTDVKYAPEEVIELLTEIEVLAGLLGTIKDVYTPIAGNAVFDAIFNRCYSLCEHGAQNLQRLARDLEKLIKPKRTMGAFKVVLRNDVVADHRSRLERAKTSLLLAQQTYIAMQQTYHTSLHVQQLQKVDTLLVTQERLISQPLQIAFQSDTPGCIQPGSIPDPCGTSGSENDVIKTPDRTTLAKKRSYRSPKREKDRLSFRTPMWLASRVWEIRVREACSGWLLGLSSYHIRPNDALVFKYARNGDLKNLQQLFDEGEASPFDRRPNGDTLLHIAVEGNQPGLCRFLLDQGVDSKAQDFCGWTPLRWLFSHISGFQSLEMYRLLIAADTIELTDRDSVMVFLGSLTYLTIPPDAMKILQQEMCFSWANVDPFHRVRLSMQTHLDNPDLAKLLLGPGPLQRAYFKVQKHRFRCVDRNLFSYIAEMIGTCRRRETEDSSWQAFLKDAIALNAHLFISERSQAPLAAFLGELWLNHTNIGSPQQPQLYWLQSMQRAGVDLVEYGRLEKSILIGAHLRCTIDIYRSKRLHYGIWQIPDVYLINLVYGPEPEDWHLWFSWPLDEWAGEFWHMVENPELFEIPGAWLEE